MDNQAFETEAKMAAGSWKREASPGRRSLLKLFAVCLLAGLLTTAVGVLSLSLVYTKAGGLVNEMRVNEMNVNEVLVKDGAVSSRPLVDVRFGFLNRLSRSEPQKYPGGTIQWATYRSDSDHYPDPEGQEFGESLHQKQSQMSVALLRIKPGGLRVPHWHFNANEHGYVLQGTVWIGVVTAENVTVFNGTEGQVVFFPRNAVHWIKNCGEGEAVLLLFFGSHEEVKTLEADEAFLGTPEDIAARALQPIGGVKFIRTFRKFSEAQVVNLPPNLGQLVHSVNYTRSEDSQVWRYLYDLGASPIHPFHGGQFQWAPFRSARTSKSPMELIYIQSLNEESRSLTLASLRIFANELGQPHYHFNANELAYVVSGCARAGLVMESGTTVTFDVTIGDVIFFPVGTQHYLRSVCDEELLLVVAYSTGKEALKTLRMNKYFMDTADHILAQLFHKDQKEFQNFPRS
ncbi:uncharacterized protein LOC128074245 [Tympanuchus pallidicinctus]|uniref:uncharacterized protein LOC128074245 n=1 Tax=Tympanuchus pallidicinctus TaxID=109042 RepID=UPI002286F628|nr:uncharacterized protein LOC128074245 [Tympanuchus pallidicinctus]